MARKKVNLRPVPQQQPDAIMREVARQFASPDFCVGSEPSADWRTLLEQWPTLDEEHEKSKQRALSGDRLRESDHSEIVSLVARGGETYARALYLSTVFARFAEMIPRRSEDRAKGRTVAGMEDIVERAWAILFPAKVADGKERMRVLQIIDRLAHHPAAIEAVREAGNAPLEAILVAWTIKKQGRTHRSKWRLIADWYASIGGKRWPEERWKKDWANPPNPAERLAQHVEWHFGPPAKNRVEGSDLK